MKRAWTPWLGLAGSLLCAGLAWAVSDARMLELYRRAVEDMLAATHESPEFIDRDGLLREIEQRVKAGEPQAAIDAWLDREMPARRLAFAPIAPPVKPNPRFLLPFDPRIHWIVGQGVSGPYSHTGAAEFALDFVMPEGTPVLAARRGTIAQVVDGFILCCLPKERASEVNAVTILHPNGVFSMYAHLRRGIPVREGQQLAAGDLVGFSGNTGYSKMPHLHFEVRIRSGRADAHSIPVRFHNGTAEGYLPKAWKLYEVRPPAGVALRVSVNGEDLASGKPFPLPDRKPAPLRVERVGDAGERVDVTRDPGTHYAALTPWSLRIDASRRVIFGVSARVWDPLPDFVRRGVAIVSIVHRTAEGREGYFDAWFKFSDVELPGATPAREKAGAGP